MMFSNCKKTIVGCMVACSTVVVPACSGGNTSETPDQGSKTITVQSSGFGGKNNNAVWVTCEGHTQTTKIALGDSVLATVYYPDHLTAALPDSIVGKKPVIVRLVDKQSGAPSVDVEVK